MWFGSRRENVPEETEPQHWPTERMIAAGETYAIPEDLEGLSNSALQNLSEICEVPTAAPDECIPCLAYAIIMDRHRETLEEAEAKLAEPFGPEPTDDGLLAAEEEIFAAPTSFPEQISPSDLPEDKPVVERFAERVKALSDLVEELLEGPPIPPPGVTQGELALLVVAAQRWVKITEAQGVALAPDQEQILAATKTLIERMNRG